MKRKIVISLAILNIISLSFAQQFVTKQEAKPLPEDTKKEVVESLAEAMKTGYVIPDKGQSVADHLNKKLSDKSYSDIKSFDMLVRQLTMDVQSVINDVHFNLFYFPPGRQFNWIDPGDSKEAKQNAEDEARAYSEKQNHGLSRIEILNGNVGYLEVASFNSDVKFVEQTVASAMQFLENTDAIIVDMRNNGGGQPEYVNLLQSYFFPKKTLLSSKYEKTTDKTNKFYSVSGIAREKYQEKPVYVLTNGGTGSGAEMFAYGIQAANRGKVIGEKTIGGAHGFSTIRLSFGEHGDLMIGMPDSRVIDPNTNSNWEGVGVIPDIDEESGKAKFRAHLEAIELLKSKSDNEQEQAGFESIIGKIRFDMEQQGAGAMSLDEYVGNYGIRTISAENGTLMLQREGGPKLPLAPIGNDEFFIDIQLTPKPKIKFIRENDSITGFNLIQGTNETWNKKSDQ